MVLKILLFVIIILSSLNSNSQNEWHDTLYYEASAYKLISTSTPLLECLCTDSSFVKKLESDTNWIRHHLNKPYSANLIIKNDSLFLDSIHSMIPFQHETLKKRCLAKNYRLELVAVKGSKIRENYSTNPTDIYSNKLILIIENGKIIKKEINLGVQGTGLSRELDSIKRDLSCFLNHLSLSKRLINSANYSNIKFRVILDEYGEIDSVNFFNNPTALAEIISSRLKNSELKWEILVLDGISVSEIIDISAWYNKKKKKWIVISVTPNQLQE